MKETEYEIDGEGYKGMRKTVTERWRELEGVIERKRDLDRDRKKEIGRERKTEISS